MKNSGRKELEKLFDVRVFLQTMITLASASLGLVAALAWNEAIKETIKRVMPGGTGLAAHYAYAIAATVLAVVVLTILGRMAARVGGEAAIQPPAPFPQPKVPEE